MLMLLSKDRTCGMAPSKNREPLGHSKCNSLATAVNSSAMDRTTLACTIAKAMSRVMAGPSTSGRSTITDNTLLASTKVNWLAIAAQFKADGASRKANASLISSFSSLTEYCCEVSKIL